MDFAIFHRKQAPMAGRCCSIFLTISSLSMYSENILLAQSFDKANVDTQENT